MLYWLGIYALSNYNMGWEFMLNWLGIYALLIGYLCSINHILRDQSSTYGVFGVLVG